MNSTLTVGEKMAMRFADEAVAAMADRSGKPQDVLAKHLWAAWELVPQPMTQPTPLLNRVDDLNNFGVWVNDGARLEDLI